jgi:pimeloyl-ACP methyl ester carboxylesterase
MAPMLCRIATLALASVAIAGCRGAAPEAPAEAEPSGCAAVEIIGIRGQGQSLQTRRGLGAEVEGIADLLADDHASLGTVRATAIRHASRLGSWHEYLEDVKDGRERLSARVRSIATDCPDTRIAVIGFSQGSQIAREELAAQPRLSEHVDVLVLVGSPVRDPSSAVHHAPLAGGVPTAGSRLGPGPDLGALADRTVEACITGDAVCAGGTDDSIHRNAYEEPQAARAIADAAAAILTQ